MERVLELHESLQEALVEAVAPRDGAAEAAVRCAWLQVQGTLRSLILFPDDAPLDPSQTDRDLILALSHTLMASLGLGAQAPSSYRELLRASAEIGVP